MPTRLNRHAYCCLIEGDVLRLKQDMPQCPERDHIIAVLTASIEHEFPGQSGEIPEDEKEHEECFVDRQLMPIAARDCDGDSWYRCPECARFTGETE